jgi:hypothetical protein
VNRYQSIYLQMPFACLIRSPGESSVSSSNMFRLRFWSRSLLRTTSGILKRDLSAEVSSVTPIPKRLSLLLSRGLNAAVRDAAFEVLLPSFDRNHVTSLFLPFLRRASGTFLSWPYKCDIVTQLYWHFQQLFLTHLR